MNDLPSAEVIMPTHTEVNNFSACKSIHVATVPNAGILVAANNRRVAVLDFENHKVHHPMIETFQS